jgi:LysM repeat protein
MLGRIAQQYGVSMDAIQRANGIRNADTIYVGQKLEIPGCNQGDRMGEMPMMEPRRPAQANMTMEMPMQPTQQPMTMGGERPTAMPRMSGPSMRPGGEMGSGMGGQMGSRTYTVQAGDMLTQIALDHGVDAYALATANGINNLNLIYVGQVLSIP